MIRNRLGRGYYELLAIVKRFNWIHSKELREILSKNLSEVSQIKSIESRNTSTSLKQGGVVLICMARSEGKLLEYWISHHASLPGVAAIILIDHRSIPPINIDSLHLFKDVDFVLFQYNAEPYLQAHVTNAVAQNLAKVRYRNGIFLPLDSDEFLSFISVTELRRTKLKFGKFVWRHIWPADIPLDSPSNSNFPPSWVFVAPNAVGGNKHFLRAKSIRWGNTWSQGAHYIQNFFGVAQTGSTLGEIFHIPVRSYQQIIEKYSRGDATHSIKQLSSSDSGDRLFAAHWKIDEQFNDDRESVVSKAMKDYYPYELDPTENNPVKFEELLRYK